MNVPENEQANFWYPPTLTYEWILKRLWRHRKENIDQFLPIPFPISIYIPRCKFSNNKFIRFSGNEQWLRAWYKNCNHITCKDKDRDKDKQVVWAEGRRRWQRDLCNEQWQGRATLPLLIDQTSVAQREWAITKRRQQCITIMYKKATMNKKATMYNNNRVNLIIIQHLAMTMRDILRYDCLIE